MKQFVRKCMEDYLKSVWAEALRYQRGNKTVYHGTIALLNLTAHKGCGAWVSRKEIRHEIMSHAGLKQQGTGLEPWIQAGVVEKGEGNQSPQRRIRPEFYPVMENVVFPIPPTAKCTRVNSYPDATAS